MPPNYEFFFGILQNAKYKKLKYVFVLIHIWTLVNLKAFHGGKFIACNQDRTFPVAENKFMPACGAMVGAITSALNREPDFIVGKPNIYILTKIERAFNVAHDEIIVVGDSFESDIMMAYSTAVLVNSNNDITNNNVLVINIQLKCYSI